MHASRIYPRWSYCSYIESYSIKPYLNCDEKLTGKPKLKSFFSCRCPLEQALTLLHLAKDFEL